MRWLLIVLFTPLVFAGELDEFLSVNPVVPVTVHCGQAYQVYVYRDNGAVDYALVSRGSEPVFTYSVYKKVLQAYLYKEHLAKSAGDIRILTPSAAPAFSQLLSKMKDEEYELSVAKTYIQKCFPELTAQVDTMDALRDEIVQRLRGFVSALSQEADRLVKYLKSKSVSCDFNINMGIYDDLETVIDLLRTYESYSAQLRASIAVKETNCGPDFVQAATSALKPPFSADQLQYFATSSATERELLSYIPGDQEIRALLQKSLKMYWKTLYEKKLDEPFETAFGRSSLRDAVQYIITSNVRWKKQDLVNLLRERYDEAVSLAVEGRYREAYETAANLQELVEEIFAAGVEEKRGFEVPVWAYGLVIITAGIIVWKWLGGRGGDGEEQDDDTAYGYDYV